jgi:hypothetical protein
MPLVFASDPAPQQLTAPCRKYSGRLHHPTEQPVYRTERTHSLANPSRIPGRLYSRAYGIVQAITKLIVVVLALTGSAWAQDPISPADRATIKGVVIDARTGVPLPRVLVAVEGGGSVETRQDGGFVLPDILPGEIHLSVSAVGYGLVQRTLQLARGETADLTIPLSEGSATYTETVTVAADRFERPEPVASQQTLNSAELQNLRGVLTDDALRAVQVLPGVATGDDFKSEFTVRGSDFAHMNFTVDGFATPFAMHMVRAVEERANSGSVSMINSDVLETVTLSNGGYAQRSGNRTGAELGFLIREGSRERPLVRASVSGTSASLTGEGPLGHGKRGSWLVSGRKSYLDLIVRKLREQGLSFAFADAQAKLRYDLGTKQSAALTVITGQSRLRELPRQPEDTDLLIADNASAILIGSWRRSLQKGVLTAAALGATNFFRNHILTGLDREQGSNNQIALRSDLTIPVSSALTLESGLLVERVEEFQRKQRPSGTSVTVINDYRADAVRYGGYLRARVEAGKRVVISPGARVDHWTLTNQTTGSPWLQTEVALPARLTLRAGGGVYQQFPDFQHVVGAFGGTALVPERSIHAEVSLEHRLSPSVRAQVAFYHREEEDVIRRPEADTRLVAGRVLRGSTTAPFATRLDGYARGVELVIQRSSPSGLSGWFSYAYCENRYEDRVTHEAFWGDLDQRHTLNAYVFYRFTPRFSASAKYRAGSNFPIPGYYAAEGGAYFVGPDRNALRLPGYGRLDLRANRTFSWSRRRLTLFAEVINVLNQDNVRFSPPRINNTTRQVTRLFDSLVPVVPSAGILFEF